MAKWHFGSPAIPATAVLLSLLAIAVPFVSATMAGGEPLRFEALVWLAAMVPAFILAYYRGWTGVATGLALGIGAFSVVQLFLVLTGRRLPDWPLVLSMTAAFVGIALVLGYVTEKLHEEREKAERLALFDPLTAVPNRRYFDLFFEKQFAAARRGRSLVLVAFDLDGLKGVNDGHGHAAGDETLRAFARVLEANTRAMDLSARLGGDEFVSLLSGSTPEGARVFVGRVQESMAAVQGLPADIGVSAGIAAFAPEMAEPAELLQAADRALYSAKPAPGAAPTPDATPQPTTDRGRPRTA